MPALWWLTKPSGFEGWKSTRLGSFGAAGRTQTPLPLCPFQAGRSPGGEGGGPAFPGRDPVKPFLVSAFGSVLELPGPLMLVKDLRPPRGRPRAPEANEQFLWTGDMLACVCVTVVLPSKCLPCCWRERIIKIWCFYVELSHDDWKTKANIYSLFTYIIGPLNMCVIWSCSLRISSQDQSTLSTVIFQEGQAWPQGTSSWLGCSIAVSIVTSFPSLPKMKRKIQ